jgi:predicted dehydrogenase
MLLEGDQTRIITIPGEDLYLGEVENMADAILHGAPTRMSLVDSRNNVATIQALLESAAKRQPIRL